MIHISKKQHSHAESRHRTGRRVFHPGAFGSLREARPIYAQLAQSRLSILVFPCGYQWNRSVQSSLRIRQHVSRAISRRPVRLEYAYRGFIAALTPGIIKTDAGKVVWNIDEYSFL